MLITFKSDMQSVIEVIPPYASILFVCCKIKILIFNRNEFINLDNSLSDDLLIPKNEKEISIHKYSDKKIRYCTIIFGIMAQATALFFLMVPLMSEEKRRSFELPMRHWLPFKVNRSNYWMVFIWQAFILIYGCAINSCSDCIFVEFIENGCAKLKILACRLESVPGIIKSAKNGYKRNQDILMIEKKILRSIFIQHQLIYE